MYYTGTDPFTGKKIFCGKENRQKTKAEKYPYRRAKPVIWTV